MAAKPGTIGGYTRAKLDKIIIGLQGPGGSGESTDPGGSNTQVQYNNGGSFAGSSNLTFNGATLTGSFTGSLAEFSIMTASSISVVDELSASIGEFNILSASAVSFGGDLSASIGEFSTLSASALTFTTPASITIVDNNASALDIREADNSYIKFDTRNGQEYIDVSKEVGFSSGLSIGDSGQLTFGDDSSNPDSKMVVNSSILHLSGGSAGIALTGTATMTSNLVIKHDSSNYVTISVDDEGVLIFTPSNDTRAVVFAGAGIEDEDGNHYAPVNDAASVLAREIF